MRTGIGNIDCVLDANSLELVTDGLDAFRARPSASHVRIFSFNSRFEGFHSINGCGRKPPIKDCVHLTRQTLMYQIGRRRQMRNFLDQMPDYIINGKNVSLRKEFHTVHAEETFCETPSVVVERAKTLLDDTLVETVARTVHERVFFEIGCCHIPLFSLVMGGRERSLFTFRCVFDKCSAFLDVRLFSAINAVKWVVMGVSHSHNFSTFPRRMPRGTFTDTTIPKFEEMVRQTTPCSEIVMKNDVFCNKHVFQNAIRSVRVDKKEEQTRELRDAARSSTLWNYELHLYLYNVFEEMFFINRPLISKRLHVDFVYVKDTSRTNQFSFPVISTLCRSECGSVHVVAWGFLKNRTTQSFRRFFSFLFKHYPGIRVFMCDRHHTQSRAIDEVFGDDVSILNYCVHIARNTVRNTGSNDTLVSLFWKMRFERTMESENAFVQFLERMHR